MSKILKIHGILLAMFISNTVNAELAIIGHIDYNNGLLNAYNVKKIFLGERQSFPDGQKARPVNHAVGSPDRKEFFDSVLAMGEPSHKRHWTRMISTGKGTSPAELSSYEDVLKWVAENPDSIAYIDARMVNDSVKVLLTIEDYSDLIASENI
jgi:hypothetical protein